MPALSNGATDWQLGFQEPASPVMQGGTNQLPKPPIKAGITTKKTIMVEVMKESILMYQLLLPMD